MIFQIESTNISAEELQAQVSRFLRVVNYLYV